MKISSRLVIIRPLLHRSLLSVQLSFATPVLAEGGLTTDGTAGRVETFTGNTVTIPQGLGTTVGGNLFHSFSQFNINSGQTVTFTETTPNALNNVITRVTGGTQSDINGKLSVTPSGHANFFLLNPAGVFFGKGAVLDVAGAFHASTADQLKFSDGGLLNVDPTQGSSLSSVAPASFGFLASTRANNGLLRVEGATLAVNDGQTLDLVGGEIKTDNATLNAPGGEIRLVALQGAGEVGLQRVEGVLPLPEAMPTTSNAGKISSNDTFIKTTGDGGGRVGLWGGEVKITAQDLSSGQGIDAFNTGAIDAALQQGIDIKVEHLTLDGVRVRTESQKDGNAGDIRLQATQDIELLKSGRINSYTLDDSAGHGGNINVSVGGNLIVDGQNGLQGAYTNIRTSGFDSSTGRVGNVNINTIHDVIIRASGGIFSSIEDDHKGNTGDVNLSIGRDLIMNGQSSYPDFPTIISTNAFGNASGNLGNIKMIVGRDLLMLSNSRIYSSADHKLEGDAGSLNIQAQGDIQLVDSSIFSDTYSTGKAGSVSVLADSNITLDGGLINTEARNGEIDADTGAVIVKAGGNLTLSPKGEISSYASADRNAANIDIKVGKDLVVNGAIKSFHPKDSPGIGGSGNIAVYSNGNVTLDANNTKPQGSISTSYVLGDAKTGDIKVSAGGKLTLLNQGSISTLSINDASSVGRLEVDAQGDIHLENGSYISASTNTQGNAGNVSIASQGNLSVANYSSITSSASAEGNAGNVSIKVKGNINLDQGYIFSSSSAFQGSQKPASGSAGNIDIFTDGSLNLHNLSMISSEAAPEINIPLGSALAEFSKDIVVNHPNLISRSRLPINFKTITDHDTGNINIQAKGNIVLDNSDITSPTSGSRDAGTINISTNGDMLITNYAVVYAGTSSPNKSQAGDAGNISLQADRQLTITEGATVAASTTGNGSAGNVDINAENVTLKRGAIFSHVSNPDSKGQAGQISLTAANLIDLADNSEISVQSHANDSDNLENQFFSSKGIRLNAQDIHLNNSSISAAAYGQTPAGNIDINFAHRLTQDNASTIQTTATSKSGGAIAITGGQLLSQHNSSIRTSVTGGQGNGGPITVIADVLLMDTGLIQANANSGNGGDINLNIKAIIPSGDSLIVGGARVNWNAFTPTFNVIQAVSESGVSGVPNITAPQLNLSGVLSNLGSALLNSPMLSPEYCNLGAGSTLVRKGRGGLRPKADGIIF